MTRRDTLSLLLGAILGIAAGVTYSWVINPLSFNETTPASLRTVYREEYVLLTALSFAKTGNLEQAQGRLAVFTDINAASELSRLAQLSLSEERPVDEARALAQLAAALSNPATPSPTAVTATPTPTGTPPSSPTPTLQPAATRVPTATPGAPFALVSSEPICDPRVSQPLLMVYVQDADGNPLPGIAVLIRWDEGQDQFFTGLKPEIGLGYGDVDITPGVVYQLELVDGQVPITGLESSPCTNELGQTYPGSIELIFQQPSP